MGQPNGFLMKLGALGTSAAFVPFLGDPQGALRTTTSGSTTVFNITAATVIKAGPGRIARVGVLVAGSAAGTINDVLTTGAAAIGNQIGTIPTTVQTLVVEWQCATGIVVVPGTGQTLVVSYI